MREVCPAWLCFNDIHIVRDNMHLAFLSLSGGVEDSLLVAPFFVFPSHDDSRD